MPKTTADKWVKPLEPAEQVAPIDKLVDNVNYWEQEIQQFIRRAEPYQIQRFMLGTEDGRKRWQIARHAAERVYKALMEGVPE